MDYQSRAADRAFSVSPQLSCRAESRHLLLSVGEVRKRKKARDLIRSPPARSAFGLSVHVAASRAAPFSTSLGMTNTCLRVDDAASEPIGVRKLPQNLIMPCWSEIFYHATKYWIEQSVGMSHIEIKRH